MACPINYIEKIKVNEDLELISRALVQNNLNLPVANYYMIHYLINAILLKEFPNCATNSGYRRLQKRKLVHVAQRIVTIAILPLSIYQTQIFRTMQI